MLDKIGFSSEVFRDQRDYLSSAYNCFAYELQDSYTYLKAQFGLAKDMYTEPFHSSITELRYSMSLLPTNQGDVFPLQGVYDYFQDCVRSSHERIQSDYTVTALKSECRSEDNILNNATKIGAWSVNRALDESIFFGSLFASTWTGLVQNPCMAAMRYKSALQTLGHGAAELMTSDGRDQARDWVSTNHETLTRVGFYVGFLGFGLHLPTCAFAQVCVENAVDSVIGEKVGKGPQSTMMVVKATQRHPM